MSTLGVVQGEQTLGRKRPVAHGGEADLFALLDRPGLLYKAYKDPRSWYGDLAELVQLPAQMSPDHQALIAERTSWPVGGVLDDDGMCIGSLIPSAPDEFWFEPSRTRTLRTVTELCYPKRLQQRGVARPAMEQVLGILRQASELLAVLHGHGVTLGDISHANWGFTLEPSPALYAIDCDSYLPPGAETQRYRQTPDWFDPFSPTPSSTSDVFKLGLLVHRIMAGDYHSDPHATGPVRRSPYGVVPSEIRKLIDRSIGQPGQRPTAAEWSQMLGTRMSLPAARAGGAHEHLLAALRGDWDEAARLLPAQEQTPLRTIIDNHLTTGRARARHR